MSLSLTTWFESPIKTLVRESSYKFVCMCCKDCNLEHVGDTESEDWKDSNGQAKFSCQIRKEKEEKEAVSKRAHGSIHE